MFQMIRRLMRREARPLSRTTAPRQSVSLPSGLNRLQLGIQRISSIVEGQLELASANRPEQWHHERPFVYGYVDALADMHVINSGKRAQGRESHALSAAVLERLMKHAWNERTMWLFQIWARQNRQEFLSGRKSAREDYAQWSDRPMTGITNRLTNAAAQTKPAPANDKEPVTD